MPILKAARSPSRRQLGDDLYDILLPQHGQLTSKIVGILLEGLPESELSRLVEDADDLGKVTGALLELLAIQRGHSDPQELDRLGAALKSDSSLQRAGAAWSLADLAMEDIWRQNIGQRTDILSNLILLVISDGIYERKNAALCMGNLCCECSDNQQVLASMCLPPHGVAGKSKDLVKESDEIGAHHSDAEGGSLFDGLIRMMGKENDETSRMFGCLALNNLACLPAASEWIGRASGCITALESMLHAETEESRQCACLCIANLSANDIEDDLQLGLSDGLVKGLVNVLRSTQIPEVEETATWALSLMCARDEINTLPLVHVCGGLRVLTPLITRSSQPTAATLRSVQYAVQIVQLAVDFLGSGSMSQEDLLSVFDALLALARSFEPRRQECAAIALAALATKPNLKRSTRENVMSAIMRRPQMLSSFMATISQGTPIAAAALAQTLADHIDLLSFHEEKFSVSVYLLHVARFTIPLENRFYQVVESLRGRFVREDNGNVYHPGASNLKIIVDRSKLLRSALRSFGSVPAEMLLSHGYQVVFRSEGVNEAGVDHGGLRRVALALIAGHLFDPANGFVVDCFGGDGERSGLIQLNPAKTLGGPAIPGHTNEEVYKLMGRMIALSLTEGCPLGVCLTQSFCKMLLIETVLPEEPNIDDLREHDEQLHRSLAVTLPTLPEPELRFALAETTFSVPSSRRVLFAQSQQPGAGCPAPSVKPSPTPRSRLRTTSVSPPGWSLRHSPLSQQNTTSSFESQSELWMSPLRPGGEEIPVTPSSFETYTALVVHKRLVTDVLGHMECVREGLRDLVCVASLSTISAEELQLLLRGEDEVDPEEWRQNTQLATGSSELVYAWFWTYVHALDGKERMRLVQWITGLRTLPHGGIGGLHHFTVLVEDGPSSTRLPSVSTCSFSLCIPNYGSYEVLAEKFDRAVLESQFARA